MSFALPQFFGYSYKPSDAVSHLAITTNWKTQVIANGGAAPSEATLTALDTFWTSMVSAGLDSLMIAVNVVAPDSLTAALTPFTSSNGSWLWTNSGFVAGDLDKWGLYASSSAKYIDTGVSCSAFPSDNDAGASQYVYSADNTNNANDFGILGTRRFLGADGIGSACYWDCWQVTSGRATGNSSGSGGMLIHCRTANNDQKLYGGNSVNGLYLIASNTNTNIGSRPPGNIYWFRQLGDSNARNIHKMSFFAIHRGLTQTQAGNFYNAVQALRTAFGGGYR